jgi:hypothetical protein
LPPPLPTSQQQQQQQPPSALVPANAAWTIRRRDADRCGEFRPSTKLYKKMEADVRYSRAEN